MSAAPVDRPGHPDLDTVNDVLINTYVDALINGDVDAALSTLAGDPVFCSPFNTWPARHVPGVFRARVRAFDDVGVDTVIPHLDRAVILWSATVNGAQVQAAEVVSISDGAISRVDVFLRPADALDAVHRAMIDAWPR